MLRLHCTEGKSYAEVAKITGKARQTVATRIQQVRRQDLLHDPAEAAAYWNNLSKGTPT
jgi:transposase